MLLRIYMLYYCLLLAVPAAAVDSKTFLRKEKKEICEIIWKGKKTIDLS